MTAMLLKLADRCEAATGPNYELNDAIALAVGWETQITKRGASSTRQWKRPGEKSHWSMRTPDFFTSSIDAAMTLLREDDVWGVSRQEGGYYQASVMPLGPKWAEAKAATPALALVAAALRTRASLTQSKGDRDDQQ